MKRIKSIYLLPLFFATALPIGHALHVTSLRSHLKLALSHALEGRDTYEILERSQNLLKLTAPLDITVSIICRNGEVVASLPAWTDARILKFCSKPVPLWREFVAEGELSAAGERLLAIGRSPLWNGSAILAAVALMFFAGFTMLLFELWWRDTLLLRQSIDEMGRIIGLSQDPPRTKSLFKGDLERRALELRSRLETLRVRQIADATKAQVGEVALQVAHDIRSPLTVLDFLSEEVEGLSTAHRSLFRSSIERVRSIAADLMRLSRRSGTPEPILTRGVRPHSVAMLVAEVVDEKKFLARRVSDLALTFDPACYADGLFAKVEPCEFRRVISNILDNAMEAMDSGSIQVRAFLGMKKIVIDIEDDGPGFSLSSAPNVGLGLTHAAKTLQDLHGRLSIEPLEGRRGSRARVVLPHAPQPTWFVNELVIPAGGRLVFLGTDSLSIKAITNRAKKIDAQDRILSVREWKDVPMESASRYLLDEVLLDISVFSAIESAHLGSRVTLLTDGIPGDIAHEAERLGMHIVPRQFLSAIKLRIETRPRVPDPSPPVAQI